MASIDESQYIEFTKKRCEDDFTFFARYFFKHLKGVKFKFSKHHYQICDKLIQIYNGEITHLIINVPPRYSKTELVVKMFSAWCFAKNPKCEFIHLSYSDPLALDNSDTIKQIIKSYEYCPRISSSRSRKDKQT